jgi:Putative DNA-binding domain
MLALAELQAELAHAVVEGDFERLGAAIVVGGSDPLMRLEIHRRNYATSLSAALREKFAATAWLVGTEPLASAARAYVRARPPRRPCIAEYGSDFPDFLASFDGVRHLPYLESFAALEWAVGQVSIAVDAPPLAWTQVARAGVECLLDAVLELQPGLRYLRSAWRVDELMQMYLTSSEAETFVLSSAETCIEVRGARGSLSIEPIDPATFAFRTTLRDGRSIGHAAGEALDVDSTFDAGDALQQLVHAGLATKIHPNVEEMPQ